MPNSDSQLLEGNKVKIGKQIVLPLSKAVEISLRGVRVRFWRSLITMSGIILAIAFLVSVWVGNSALDGLKAQADRKVLVKVVEESDAFSYVVNAAGEVRTVKLLRERDIRLYVAEILRNKGLQVGESGEAPAQAARGPAARGTGKSGSKDLWLVALSLCVAVVGIVNAMLMSVTERFREIGTMKCLGAMDSFIVKLFLLESTFLGAIGTAIGIAIGLLLTAVSSLISYWALRGLIFSGMPWGDVLQAAVFAFAAGVVLSVVGTVYPAIVAARMEPVVAMRQEA
jgi:ABC-type antimicrobial peptide transport system permease subunit